MPITKTFREQVFQEDFEELYGGEAMPFISFSEVEGQETIAKIEEIPTISHESKSTLVAGAKSWLRHIYNLKLRY